MFLTSEMNMGSGYGKPFGRIEIFLIVESPFM